jgi:hypothetical protein
MAVIKEKNQSKQELEKLTEYLIKNNIPGKIKEVCKYYGKYFSYNGDYVYAHNIETDSDSIRRTFLMEDGDSAGIHMYFYDFDENGKAVRKEQIYDQIFDITKKPERAYLVLCKYMDEWIPIVEKLYSEIDYNRLKKGEVNDLIKETKEEIWILCADYETAFHEISVIYNKLNKTMETKNKIILGKLDALSRENELPKDLLSDVTELVDIWWVKDNISQNEFIEDYNKLSFNRIFNIIK